MSQPEPVVLAFDTAAAHVAAALLCGDRIVTQIEPMGTGQAERLMPLLEELLVGQGLTWRDLTVIGVGTGPGNFTGIRISVAAARGLALGLGVPAIGVSGFDALTWGIGGAAVIETTREMAYLRLRPDSLAELVPLSALTGPATRMSRTPPDTIIANLARAALALSASPQPRPAPLYVRAPDAAPPRDPAPVILP